MTDGAFARFRAGDNQAARDAVRDYLPITFTAAFGVLRDAPSAEIISANVLIEGLAGGSVPQGSPLVERTWAVATARAHALAAYRSHRRRGFGARRRSAEAPATAREAWMEPPLDVDLAYTAYENLDAAWRDALGLAYGSGFDPEALARRLGYSTDEARDALREGLVALETALTEHTP